MVALVAGACSGGQSDLGPSATLGTAPTTSASERVIDPSVIPADPADIDEAYVQAVVDALFEVDAKATKIYVETKDVTNKEAAAYLRSIYVPEEFERQINLWFQDLALRSGELLPGVLGNEVRRVLDAASDCVYVEVIRDYSSTSRLAAPPRAAYLGLTPKLPDDDPSELNPTAWMLFMSGVDPEPGSPCEGR